MTSHARTSLTHSRLRAEILDCTSSDPTVLSIVIPQVLSLIVPSLSYDCADDA